jgi:hypothetical protein
MSQSEGIDNEIMMIIFTSNRNGTTRHTLMIGLMFIVILQETKNKM